MDISFRQSNNTWPLEAVYQNTKLVFSGTFTQARISSEQRGSKIRQLAKVLLWILAGLGLAAVVLNLWQGFDPGQPLFVLDRNIYNLVFWVSIVGDLYLWAMYREARIEQGQAILKKFTGLKMAGELDVYEIFNSAARNAWNAAWTKAQAAGRAEVSVSDVLAVLIETSDVQVALFRLGIRRQEFKAVAASGPTANLETLLQLPYVALMKTIKLHNNLVDPIMLFCAVCQLLPEDHPVQQYLFELGVSQEILETVAVWIFNLRLITEEDQVFQHLAKLKPSNELDKGMTAVPTRYLDQFSQDITMQAKYHRLPIAVGRENDLANIFKTLAEHQSSLLIKGEEGTGRTTLINMLAHHMVMEDVPPLLQDKRLVRLETAALVGSKLPAEQVLLQALTEAANAGNIVLAIEDIDALARAQGSQGLSLLEILVNHLQASPLVVIATTTPDKYLNYMHQQPNFDQVFTAYELEDMTGQAVLVSCCIRASLLEAQTGTVFLFSAIQQAIDLSDRYFKDAAQPQKAISLLTEAATEVKNSNDEKIVTPAVIQKIVGQKTHIPEESISQSEGEKLLHLEDELGKYIIGQKEAVSAVAESLRRARSGLSSSSRPLASFLFVGPTGVGKTELAKTLTKIYFGDQRYLLRLDMSEYQGDLGLQKLLGQPGAATNTPFVNHLKNYPFCLFLLDEFEKASRDVLNLFLQILEDGRLTTTAGETLDLTQTIIIATSNAGTKDIQAGLQAGQSLEHIKSILLNQILLNYYPPELLNRFDGVILFTPLSHEEVERITALQLAGLSASLLDKGMKITFGPGLVADVAANAYDPLLGARPIRRYIQDHVESAIAKLILSQQLKRGAELTIDMADGRLVINN